MIPTTPATQAQMQAAVAPTETKVVTKEEQQAELMDLMQTKPELAGLGPKDAFEALKKQGHPMFQTAWAGPGSAPWAKDVGKPQAPAAPAPAASAAPVTPQAPGGVTASPVAQELFAQPPRVPAPAPAQPAVAAAAPQLPAVAAPALPAARQAHAVARPGAPSTGLEGLGTLDQEDVRIPAWKIRQPTTGGGDDAVQAVPVGSIFLSFDPAGHKPKRITRILDVTKGRSLLFAYGNSNDAKAKAAQLRERLRTQFGLNVPEDAKAACSSSDRVRPTDRGWGVVSPTCAACPFSKSATVGGVWQPPPCSENYKYILFDKETQTPAVYIGKGRAIKQLKNLNTNLLIAGNRDKRPPAGYETCIETKKETDGTNVWYVPTFGPLAPVSDEDMAAGIGLRRTIVESAGALDAAEDHVEAEA